MKGIGAVTCQQRLQLIEGRPLTTMVVSRWATIEEVRPAVEDAEGLEVLESMKIGALALAFEVAVGPVLVFTFLTMKAVLKMTALVQDAEAGAVDVECTVIATQRTSGTKRTEVVGDDCIQDSMAMKGAVWTLVHHSRS